MSKAKQSVREAVAVFDDIADLDEAVAELRAAGFAKDDINILAGVETVEKKLGRRFRRVEELEEEPAAPRVVFEPLSELEEREKTIAHSLTILPTLLAAGTVVASGGALAAAIVATAVAGALLATVLTRWMDERRARWLHEQLERGGILLWVRTPDAAAERKAVEILMRHSTHDVHVHELPVLSERS